MFKYPGPSTALIRDFSFTPSDFAVALSGLLRVILPGIPSSLLLGWCFYGLSVMLIGHKLHGLPLEIPDSYLGTFMFFSRTLDSLSNSHLASVLYDFYNLFIVLFTVQSRALNTRAFFF